MFAGWQFRAQGFRPHCSVRIDARRQAIRLQIRNRGRANGAIERIVIVDPAGFAINPAASIAGYEGGNFKPTTLPGLSAMSLIITPPLGTTVFPEGVRVKADWGTGETTKLPQPVDVGYAGLPSVLPPGFTQGP
jgi:hypothetical protein